MTKKPQWVPSRLNYVLEMSHFPQTQMHGSNISTSLDAHHLNM